MSWQAIAGITRAHAEAAVKNQANQESSQSIASQVIVAAICAICATCANRTNELGTRKIYLSLPIEREMHSQSFLISIVMKCYGLY